LKIKKEEKIMAISKVNTSGMRTTANDIEQMSHDYTQQVASLYTVGQELDAMWDGDASDTFQTRLGQDQPRFEALNTVIKQYVEAARKFADDYDRNEALAVEIAK